jgi:patatin-like phospholipase/acyl hydrolase
LEEVVMPEPVKPFRILSLDGGGIRGVYAASALAEIENTQNISDIWNYFDLMIGTSTGGIIAIALASGITATDILSFYIKSGSKIFPHTGVGRRAWRSVASVFRPKHSWEPLEQELGSILQNKTLRDTYCRVGLTAYSTERNDLQLFKNYTPGDKYHHLDLSCVSVAMASSAAPTYFRAYTFSTAYPELNQGLRRCSSLPSGAYLDGGVCANCPIVIGVVEAFSTLPVAVQDIQVLSVGTLYHNFRVSSERQRGGLGQWNIGAIDLLMHGQQACAVTTAEALLGDRMIRVTQETLENIPLDDVTRISDLACRGRSDLLVPRGARCEAPMDGIRRLGFFSHRSHWPFRPPAPDGDQQRNESDR